MVGDNGENTTFVGQFDSLSKAHEQFDKYMADFCKGWAKGSDPCEVRSQPSFDLLPYTQQMQDAETGSQISTIVLACRSAAVEAYEQFVRDSQQNGSKICPVVSNQKDATILANLCDQYGEEYKAQLTKKLLCGNGNLEPQEECDDGNTTDGDGCSSTCQTEQQPTSGN